ncbi:MAG TPA: hypothetical protein P5136_00160 [Methanofastidiosum sp.]|nr:hypothetical protein [Methanofastidiosum sp.]
MAKKLKLNQFIAIANGEKSRKQKNLTALYHTLQKADLFAGMSRKYTPIDAEGETLPDEVKRLQATVPSIIKEGVALCENMFNVVAAQDLGNCNAKADVVVDGKTILEKVPVTHLLFLEKQLTDLLTFVTHFPTLDPSEDWKFDDKAMYYVSIPRGNIRTKKVSKVLIKYEATKEHPAQTEVYTDDVKIGEYETVRFSGCVSNKDKELFLEKIRKLDKAVKLAREEANSIDVEESDLGTKVLDYIFK